MRRRYNTQGITPVSTKKKNNNTFSLTRLEACRKASITDIDNTTKRNNQFNKPVRRYGEQCLFITPYGGLHVNYLYPPIAITSPLRGKKPLFQALNIYTKSTKDFALDIYIGRYMNYGLLLTEFLIGTVTRLERLLERTRDGTASLD